MARRTTHWTLRIATEPWEAKTRLEAEYKRSGYNITKMSRRLGLSRQTIYSYFGRLNIKPPPAPQLPPTQYDIGGELLKGRRGLAHELRRASEAAASHG